MVNYWDEEMRALLGGWNQEAESLLLGEPVAHNLARLKGDGTGMMLMFGSGFAGAES
jgi:hypothetical protein